ncbi:MAG: ribosome biogenesis GTPase Der, partial [Clostridia bacterium]|nr:ribosome biogenesis GTPase Der [Clostridia bacterium]
DDPDTMYDFYELGFGTPIAISAEHGLGIGDLLDEVVKHFDKNGTEEDVKAIKIAVIGKPNAGKSSLTNKILNYERSIVSDISGTTRDAIDTPFRRNGKDYLIIDTAGIRKKSKIEGGTVERYAVVRSFDAVRRSDVVIITVDATFGVTEQDVKIAGYAHEEGRAIVIAVNKWDLIEKDTHTVNQFKKDIQCKLAFMTYAPIIYISALTGQRVNKVMDYVDYVNDCANRKIPTGLLNDCLGEATAISEPPSKNGRRLKIYYATQVAVSPPTFLLFVNDTELMHFSYLRYLENYFRKSFDFTGTPIRINVRYKNEKEME